jgi:hypothetical protein
LRFVLCGSTLLTTLSPSKGVSAVNQIISNTGFESPCSTKGGELPLLPFGYSIGFVPASRGGVYIKSNCRDTEPAEIICFAVSDFDILIFPYGVYQMNEV